MKYIAHRVAADGVTVEEFTAEAATDLAVSQWALSHLSRMGQNDEVRVRALLDGDAMPEDWPAPFIAEGPAGPQGPPGADGAGAAPAVSVLVLSQNRNALQDWTFNAPIDARGGAVTLPDGAATAKVRFAAGLYLLTIRWGTTGTHSSVDMHLRTGAASGGALHTAAAATRSSSVGAPLCLSLHIRVAEQTDLWFSGQNGAAAASEIVIMKVA